VTLYIDRKLMEWIRTQAQKEQRKLSIIVDRALRAEQARCAAHPEWAEPDFSLEEVRQE
jgi:hypothetical protein